MAPKKKKKRMGEREVSSHERKYRSESHCHQLLLLLCVYIRYIRHATG